MSSRIDALAEIGGATFSEDGRYRYTLGRRFDGGRYMRPRTVFFIMLNPSTADQNVGDPSVRRCMKYAYDWGYDKMVVLNLFALRSTDPKELYRADDPIGPENDAHIKFAIQGDKDHHVSFGQVYRLPPRVICAWGNHGLYQDRWQRVRDLIVGIGCEPYALKITGAGQPAHPLYLPANLEPQPWR